MDKANMDEQPLLISDENWTSLYEHMGRSGSAVIPTPSITVQEFRCAAATPQDIYPPHLHAALITDPKPEPKPKPPTEQDRLYQGKYGGGGEDYGEYFHGNERQTLDEVEIRELLIDHVGHRCCWGSRPARTWKIHAVEDCNVYVGTLDTFIEERETIQEKAPRLGGATTNVNAAGKDKGPQMGIWELDLRSEFPVLFTPHKETRTKLPNSEVIEKCPSCAGRGDIICQMCNKDKEDGYYKENQMAQCPACHGRGLLAHRDGSDSICLKCNGKGKIPCATCGSRGLVKCVTCTGCGSLLTSTIAVVRWKTLSSRKVSATSGAASVPDEVFHRAKGVELCNTQAYQCAPAFFADSFFLNKFSSEVIAERAHVPPTARVICERHTISVVPMTRVTMSHGHGDKSSFSFYIIGLSREVYLKNYYPSRFCWGLCPCFEWLKL